MIITAEIEGKSYKFDSQNPIDISMPIRFDNNQFKAFGASPAVSEYYSGDDFTVSVESGSGCNCPVFVFAAHLHGTHTECVGHISSQEHIFQDVIHEDIFIRSTLISVEPVTAANCDEKYIPDFEKNDIVITEKMLQQKITDNTDALVIRTLPNDTDKLTRNYDDALPPFFTNDAMQYICDLNVQHLLVDMPSVDRLQDEGRLSNHHIYWGVPQGSHDVPKPSPKTITEFIFASDDVKDGAYILNLNIGNIRSDAAPSKPTIYEIL